MNDAMVAVFMGYVFAGAILASIALIVIIKMGRRP